MKWYEITLGILTILNAVVLLVLVMLQESKSQGLSGAIAGGADTFFGKNKGRAFEDKLVKYTKIFAVVFFVLTFGTTLLLLFRHPQPAAALIF
ncbi:MAG: preprotein translocase subunit SecG [Oscillospiraceae bacterium]|nr:preprotein translocase subunit SecG [Oscillospiraceae bacterium]